MSRLTRPRLHALANRRLTFGPVLSWSARNATALLIGLGVVFRLAQYLADRSPWMDEGSLASNITTARSPADFLGQLRQSQLAPPGFLAVEWVARRVFGRSYFSLRLPPLLCGIASLALFRRVARECLSETAATVALALFATSDGLIYFASELKQYSSDVAVSLACTLAGLVCLKRDLGPARLLALALTGIIAVWFSHPSAFTLAGIGATLVVSSSIRRSYRRALLLSWVCLAWTLSFSEVFLISRVQLPDQAVMQVFWGFAFPPMPPHSPGYASWWSGRLAYLFVNPLGFNTPFGSKWFALPALAFGLIGLVSSLRSNPERFGMLAGPLGSTIGATSLRLYPFHGRLVLFLVPAMLIFIAVGACRVGEWAGKRWVWLIVLGSILLFPTIRDFGHLISPRNRNYFNRFGDLDPYQIDPARFPF